MQQSWRGVFCADCEGIETSLFLAKDGTWVMNQRYQGAKELLLLPLMEHGRARQRSWS
jgi:uncharacterized lipoprotein NlpE involved in copper resistance